jgi:predicted nucleic acid-binding protein
LKVYLDTCIVVSLFAGDSFSMRAETFTSQTSLKFLVSDFACAEFASVISRAVRTRELTKAEAKAIFRRFDVWKENRAQHIETETADVAAAEAFLRQLNVTLFAPDALHIAMAKRAGAVLATFDTKMAASVKNLGLDLAGA